MKQNSNTDCTVNVKNVAISDELGQNLSRSTESPGASSKRINGKVHFNVVRNPNIPLGRISYGENVCFFNSLIQVFYCLP